MINFLFKFKLNKFAYLYSKPLVNHTLKIMKKIPGNLLKYLEKWNFVSPKKVGTLVHSVLKFQNTNGLVCDALKILDFRGKC